MNLKEYAQNAKVTLSPLETDINVIHMILGLVTETGELADAIKKDIAYGKKIDWVNFKEEIGDVMWYIVNLCTILDVDLEDILESNINKLKIRYPEGFSKEKAENRDLTAERRVLEGTSVGYIMSEKEVKELWNSTNQ